MAGRIIIIFLLLEGISWIFTVLIYRVAFHLEKKWDPWPPHTPLHPNQPKLTIYHHAWIVDAGPQISITTSGAVFCLSPWVHMLFVVRHSYWRHSVLTELNFFSPSVIMDMLSGNILKKFIVLPLSPTLSSPSNNLPVSDTGAWVTAMRLWWTGLYTPDLFAFLLSK